MIYYVIVWKHDTMKLADTRLYVTEDQAREEIRGWAMSDPSMYTFRMVHVKID